MLILLPLISRRHLNSATFNSSDAKEKNRNFEIFFDFFVQFSQYLYLLINVVFFNWIFILCNVQICFTFSSYSLHTKGTSNTRRILKKFLLLVPFWFHVVFLAVDVHLTITYLSMALSLYDALVNTLPKTTRKPDHTNVWKDVHVKSSGVLLPVVVAILLMLTRYRNIWAFRCFLPFFSIPLSVFSAQTLHTVNIK